jgi:hypothetical protein
MCDKKGIILIFIYPLLHKFVRKSGQEGEREGKNRHWYKAEKGKH